MTNSTQKDFVITQLNQTGQVSRNYCLKNYITRLSSIIFNLKDEGYEFIEKWIPSIKPDGSKGKDFVYIVTKRPGEITESDTNPMF